MAETILLVEDEDDFAESMGRTLRAAGYEVFHAASAAEAAKRLKEGGIDVILSDIHLPDGNGLDLLKKFRADDRLRPVVLITASGTADLAVEATLHGAFDYLLKPLDRVQLLDVMGKAAASRACSRKAVHLPTRARKGDGQAVVGAGPAMVRLFKDLGRVAAQPVPVLLRGETGTGKELIARALYRYSGLQEKGRPFIPVNCAAIPETLLESELFGHEKGAFTGAQTRRIGRFQQAEGGMIFLDEIGEIPLAMQAKLLRVLQEKEIQTLGGAAALKIHVRVIAATHRNLEREVAAGRFREDLYFRLNVATLFLPALRERREDVAELASHFLRHHAEENGEAPPRITREALRWLQQRPWPGNVRELENTMKRAAMLAAGGVVGLDQAQEAAARGNGSSGPEEQAGSLESFVARHLDGNGLLARLEQEAIALVLRKAAHNKTRAAEILGINRKTLREKLAYYRIPDEPPA